MKTVFGMIFGLLLSFTTLTPAQAQIAGIKHSRMNYIVDRVRNCSILPYTMNSNRQKVYHALTSHCPEVKVVGKGTAKIRVDGHAFQVNLVETINSDGDFYDVQITDVVTREVSSVPNILAFGDVLLGVLSGRTQGLPESYVSDRIVPELDQNLVQTSR
jgi:hypothetical protein